MHELKARVVFDEADEHLIGVRAGVESQATAHHGDTLANERGFYGWQRVCLAGKQPQNHVFADHAPARVEAAHPNVVEVVGTLNGGAGVRLRNVEWARPERAGEGVVFQPDAVLSFGRPQDTQRRVRAVCQFEYPRGAVEQALFDTHKEEVTAGKPAQKVLCDFNT